MFVITQQGGEPTMTTLDLRSQINVFREECGESPVEYKHFLARVEDELKAEWDGKKFPVQIVNRNNTVTNYYHLTQEECLLVGMRESKAVRRKVVGWLKALNAAPQPPVIPQSLPEALRLAADLAEENQRITEERDQAIKTKAQISSSREAAVMGRLSGATRKLRKLEEQLGFNTRHAAIIAVENATGRKFDKQAWRALKKWCVDHGVEAKTVPCPRWGEAKAWPAGAWLECYEVDLAKLFGAEDAA